MLFSHSLIISLVFIQKEGGAFTLRVLLVSPLLKQVLRHREATRGCCQLYPVCPPPPCQGRARTDTALQRAGTRVLPSAVVSNHWHSLPPCQPPARTGTGPQGGDHCVLPCAVVSCIRIRRLLVSPLLA